MGNFKPGDIFKVVDQFDNTIYTVCSNSKPVPPGGGLGVWSDDLCWRQHKGYDDGSPSWNGPRLIKTDWLGWFDRYQPCVPGGNGLIYVIGKDGKLQLYNHRGNANGAASLSGPYDVGDGWYIGDLNSKPEICLGIFCDTGNESYTGLVPKILRQKPIIYAVRRNGQLLWYRHDGAWDGTRSWANGGVPKPVGNGWVEGFQRVFSGCNGIIYLIKDDGRLFWYEHKGYQDGSNNWEQPQEVGSGWNNFSNVFSIGEGVIYAIDNAGFVWWYKHKGYQDGTPAWEQRKKLGSIGNLDFDRVICNSVYLKYKPQIIK